MCGKSNQVQLLAVKQFFACLLSLPLFSLAGWLMLSLKLPLSFLLFFFLYMERKVLEECSLNPLFGSMLL